MTQFVEYSLSSKKTYAIKFREWLTDDNIVIEFIIFNLTTQT